MGKGGSLPMIGVENGRSAPRVAAWSAAAAVALSVLGGAAAAQGGPEGLRQLLQLAVETNSGYRLAAAQLEAARASLAQIQAESGPSAAVSGDASHNAALDNSRDGGAKHEASSLSLRLDLTYQLQDGGRLDARIGEQSLRVESAGAALRQTEQQVISEGVDVFLSILEGRELLRLAEGTRDKLQAEVDAAEDRFRLGIGTRTDIAQAESRFAEAESAVSARRGELAVFNSQFESAFGFLPPSDLPDVEAMPELPASLDAATDMALESHPLLAARRADLQAALRGRDVEVAPGDGDGLQTYAFGSLSHESEDNANLPGWRTRPEVGVGLRYVLTLFDNGVGVSEVEEAEQLVNVARASLAVAEAQVRLDVSTAWHNLTVSSAVIASDGVRSDAAKLALEGIRSAARVGQASTLDLLNGERELLDAETAVVQSGFARRKAAYALLAAIGAISLETLPL